MTSTPAALRDAAMKRAHNEARFFGGLSRLTFPAVVALVVVGVCAARADLALLLLVATAPLEVLLPGGSGGGLTVTKVAGALCFTSLPYPASLSRGNLS